MRTRILSVLLVPVWAGLLHAQDTIEFRTGAGDTLQMEVHGTNGIVAYTTIDMNANRIIDIGQATASTDAVRFDQIGSVNGPFIQLQPAGIQPASAANPLIWLNETNAGTPALITIQVAAVTQFAVANNGTITFGTWGADTISPSYGGTGSATIGGAGTMPYSNGASLAYSASGTSGQDLLISGGTGAPTWGTAISGSLTTEFSVQTSNAAANSRAVFGDETAATGTVMGVWGQALVSPDGIGVYGEGLGTGVYGRCTGATAGDTGVFGTNASASTSGTKYGVYGNSQTAGATATNYGVYGIANSAGTNYGVMGETSTASGIAVYGLVTGTGGAVVGVQGVIGNTGVDGLTSTGVSGTSSRDDNSGTFGATINRGVYGLGNGTTVSVGSALTNNFGVYGEAIGAPGTGTVRDVGVYGFVNNGSPAVDNAGVMGETTTGVAPGVFGLVTGSASDTEGVWGENRSSDTTSDRVGVGGESAQTLAGINIGVEGTANNASTANVGVRGSTITTNGIGVRGVFAVGAGTGGIGVNGLNESSAGSGAHYGVYGEANGSGGGTSTHYGVYGTASGGNTNWAVYSNGAFFANGAMGGAVVGYAASGGNNNDVSTTGATALRVTSGASFTITGLTGGFDGRVLILINTSTANMTISHQDPLSTSANQITTSTGVSLSTTNNGSAILVYDGTSSKWVVVSFEP